MSETLRMEWDAERHLYRDQHSKFWLWLGNSRAAFVMCDEFGEVINPSEPIYANIQLPINAKLSP